jgi:type I restriction enzyme S subunit
MALTVPVDEIVSISKNPLLQARAGWGRVRLGEIATVLNGFAFKSDLFTKNRGVPLIRIRDVGASASNTCYAGEFDARYLVRRGELLIGMDGDFNCARWRGEPGLLNQRVCKVTLHSDEYDERFLDYVLPGYLKAINDATSSITVKHLSSRTVEEIPLPRPPIQEQKAIVHEFKKQFSRLDEAVANVKRVKANLKRYKTAVLKAAVEGRLVPTEAELVRRDGGSYETGAQLLQRTLETHRSQSKGKYKGSAACDVTNLPDLPEGWVWATLASLSDVIGGLTKNPKRAALPMKLPYLRVANVYANELRLEEIEQIGVEKSELEKLLVLKDDLLIVEGNGSPDQIGRLAIWDGSINPCVHQNHLIKVRLPSECVVPKWVVGWLMSPDGRTCISEVANSTSGLYTLSVGKVGGLPVPLPPLAEQHRIVAEVDRRLSLVSGVEAEVDANMRRSSSLKSAVLQRAFSSSS